MADADARGERGDGGLPRDWLIEQFRALNMRFAEHSRRTSDRFDHFDARFDKLEEVHRTVASHATSIEVHDESIRDLRQDVKDVSRTTAYITGSVAVGVTIVNYLLGRRP